MSEEYKYKLWEKVVIKTGRLKGESGVVVGETNLNYDYRIIVRRDNKFARNKIMGFQRYNLLEAKP